MTLTLPLIRQARRIQFVVTGHRKAAVIAQVLRGGSDLPAARVAEGHPRVEWLLDAAAAAVWVAENEPR